MFVLAGRIPINPLPHTLREVFQMLAGRLDETWNHTAHLMAAIHNSRCSRPQDTRNADFFNPREAERSRQPDVTSDAAWNHLDRVLGT